jgi:uracil-DNA glycosylase
MTPPDPPPAWADLPFFRSRWPALWQRLASETRPWQPGPGAIFRALELTPPDSVRVVILGQDPYPTPGVATGLAFSVPDEAPLPRSLANIFRELREDTGLMRASGDLSDWARQGVLLLNAALTVPVGEANGHAHLGWRSLTDEVLALVAARPTAFVLWGRPAERIAAPHVAGTGHLVLRSAHPSPLSAARGFFGSRPFSAVNRWLEARGEPPVCWA